MARRSNVTSVDNPLRAGSASGTGRAASTGEVSHIPDVLADPGLSVDRGPAPGRLPREPRGPALARKQSDRRLRPGAADAGPVHATPDRTRANLRRPGRDRDRERAAVRRGAGAHARPHRSAATADRDLRRAEGHQPLGVRSAGGVRYADRFRRRTLRRATAASICVRDGDVFRYRGSAGAADTRGARQISRGSSGDAGAGIDGRPGALVRQGAKRFPTVSRTRNSSCRWMRHRPRRARPAGRAAARERRRRGRAGADAHASRAISPTARSRSCRPSPTRP